MATFSVLSHFLLPFAAFLLVSDSSLTKVPQSHGAAGVFLLIEGGKYTFNSTAARDACERLNLTVASRAQMERAVQHGLETCKYGWIAGQIAAVPRRTSDRKCGQGKTGVVTWAASTRQKFGVYCFNASDLEENGSTLSPQSSSLTAATRTSAPAAPTLRSTTASPPATTAKTPERTSVPSAPSTRSPTSTSPTQKPPSTHTPPLPPPSPPPPPPPPPPSPSPHSITSKPVVTFSSSSSPHASSFSASSESAMPRPTGVTKPPLGDVPTALIVLSVIVLLLTAAGVVWYYKLNIFTLWSQGQQKDDTETEMWKHADSETELHSQQDGDEEEDGDRKYSSDITLCVNPDMKTDSAQDFH